MAAGSAKAGDAMYIEEKIVWHCGRDVRARLTYELRRGIRGYTEARLVGIEELAEESPEIDRAEELVLQQ
ncbi:MAG TPA: hypothetical protein VFA54_03970 [Bryobacterales bacterium]|nr:hypothetical protein [Bryobacterales bacterium]